MEKSIARQISEFSVDLTYENLPKEVIHEVKRYMYDSIGCAYGGYHTNDVNIMRADTLQSFSRFVKSWGCRLAKVSDCEELLGVTHRR